MHVMRIVSSPDLLLFALPARIDVTSSNYRNYNFKGIHVPEFP